MDEYKIVSIEEGLTKIEFPEYEKVSSAAPVFYNPHMEMNRDLSILAIQTFQKEQDREINICDLFGGSGIRGVRYKNEIDGVGEVSINDISETANHYERHNIELNNLNDVHVYQHDASMFLRMKRGEFDVIDIDPFGTPSPFLDSAGYCARRNSLMCVTATDTSALCGTYEEPCIRKYNSKPYKSEYCHETGIESLKNIGYISHCKHCLHRQTSNGLASPIDDVCPVCGEKLVHAGPLWLGKIQDGEFIQKMIDEADNKKINSEKEALKLLNKCLVECDAPATFYDVHSICKSLKISAPKFELILNELEKEGFKAIRTHYNPIGIKSDAGIEDIKNILIKLNDI